MVWMPHVTVAAIAERNGYFLMVEENYQGRLVLNQPAGHLNKGESLTEAVVRETLEETAWTLRLEALTGVYRWHHPTNDTTFLRFCFSGSCETYDPSRPLDREIERTLWMTRAELATASSRLRSPMVLRCIDDYLRGNRYPLALIADC
jgi:ADP-ribose pyrophosphatase